MAPKSINRTYKPERAPNLFFRIHIFFNNSPFPCCRKYSFQSTVKCQKPKYLNIRTGVNSVGNDTVLNHSREEKDDARDS